MTFSANAQQSPRRHVLRIPPNWNGSLVIGAHGGSGGNAIDRSGKVYGTSETALDDVIGRYAFEKGYAYGSVDRDGIGSSADGVKVTLDFVSQAKAEVTARGGKAPVRTFLVGLSAGGGITRAIIEQASAPVDGAVIIAGAGGDATTRLDRQKRMAALWPLIDPAVHKLPNTDPNVQAYAEAIGTPVAARRLWPYTGSGAVAAAARPAGAAQNTTAKPTVPVMEVVGTWDDLVIREIRAYAQRVAPKDRHRLYQVDGVWHMSGDDDGVQGFQYNAESRMKLGKDVADAMGESPSYIPTVREAFDHLARWVEQGTVPPPSQTVKPAQPLSP